MVWMPIKVRKKLENVERWDLAKRFQNLDITDDVVHATNHYKEDMSPGFFTKHHNPKVRDNKAPSCISWPTFIC